MTRKQELLLTITSNLILQFVTAICGFILPPLIIRTFGSTMNGMISSITQFIAYLNLVEAGIGAASIAALYKPLATENFEKINEILSAAKKFYFRSGFVFSAGIVVLAFVYPLIAGKEVDNFTSTSRLMVLILGISGSAEFFLIGKYRVLLVADKKIYVISFLQSAAMILNTTVAVILINKGFGILTVKLSSSLVYLSRFFVLSFYIRRKYKFVSLKSVSYVKEISQSKNALVHQISGFVVYNSPLIILTIFCGLKEVSVYSVYALVFTAINNILTAFSNGLQAFFGESLVKDSNEKIKRFYTSYETSFFSLMFWGYSCAHILILPFMNLYTSNMIDENYIRPILSVLLVISGILTNIRQPGSQMINAAGHFEETQWRSIAEASINIVFSVIFTLKFGIYGVVAGNICSSLYRGIDVILYTNHHILKIGSVKSFVKILFLTLIFLLMVLIVRKIPFDFKNWEYWLLNAVLVAVMFSVPVFFFLYYSRKLFLRGR